jgi:hypothetical protein
VNLSLLAASGWGKSWLTQTITERNFERYDYTVVLDYKDEYRGLCSKQHGPAPAKHYLAGNAERNVGPGTWAGGIEDAGNLVVGRHSKHLDNEAWREVCASIIEGARHHVDGTTLVVVDEGHFVAPQAGNYPDSIEGLATTGRGEGNSAMWVTQRPASIDKQVLGNATARFIGGFENHNDLSAAEDTLNYPAEAHNSGGQEVRGLPEQLHAPDAGPISVRKWSEEQPDGSLLVTGSEWIYSDESGAMKRLRSDEAYSPACDHVGASGMRIDVGV